MKNAIASRNAIRAMMRSAVSVASSWSTTMMPDDREDDEEPAHRRVHSGEERAHVPVMYARTGKRSCNQGSAGEPAEPGAPVGRRVQPRGEHGEERERAVQVVQVLRRALVLGEQEQTERDLGDEDGLCEREQVRDDRPRLPLPQVGDPGDERGAPRDREHEECDGVVDRQHRPTMIAEG